MAGEKAFEAPFAASVAGEAGHGDGGAVVRKIAGHDLGAAHLAPGREVLQGDLQRRIHAFGAAAGEMDVMKLARQPVGAEPLDQRLALGRAPRGNHEGGARRGLADGRSHLGAAMTDIDDDRAAGSVEDPAPVVGDQPRSLAVHDPRRAGSKKRPVTLLRGSFDHGRAHGNSDLSRQGPQPSTTPPPQSTRQMESPSRRRPRNTSPEGSFQVRTSEDP